MKARALLLLVPLLAGMLGGCGRPDPAPPSLWSDAKTWGGRVPRRGDDVVVPRGRRIVMDVSPPPLGRLEVEGDLKVADQGLTLRTETLLVSGRLSVGTQAARLRRPFRLEMDTTRIAQNPDAGLMMIIGRLELYGRDLPRTWTRLDGTAKAGATSIRLAEDLPVAPGDRIVLAATGFDPDECETAEVLSFRGRDVKLEAPLRHAHFGRITAGVDERGEVGILSRNVRIVGRGVGPTSGHLVVAALGRAEIDGAEFARMGQGGRLSRYPIHFHLAGDQSASFVRNAAVHDCFNRALTVHGTQNLRVSGLVAYRSYGHLVFLEDGVETGCHLTDNLALRPLAPPESRRLLDSDASPAGFWVTNPANDLHGNVAAGSDGEGFWLAFPKGPTGASAGVALQPRRTDLGVFDGNTAHSNRANGLFVDGSANPPGVYDSPSYVPRHRATFDRFTAYKNGKRGVWMRGARLDVARATLADNPIGVTLAASESVVRDSLIVGETANGELLKPGSPTFPVRGFEFYDGLVGVVGTTFRNFVPNGTRGASALSGVRFSPFFVNPYNYVERLRFENARPVFFDSPPLFGTGVRSADGYRSLCFRDLDGSVAESPNATVSIANPFLAVPGGTRVRPEWNAYVTSARYARIFVDLPEGDPKGRITCTIRHADRSGGGHRMGGNPYEGGATSFQTSILPNGRYRVGFEGGRTPRPLRIAVRYLGDDHLDLDLPEPEGPYRVTLNKRAQQGEAPVEGTSVRRLKGRLLLRIAGRGRKDPVVEIVKG